MINTLYGNNSSFANLGKVAIQPAAVSSPQFLVKTQTSESSTKPPVLLSEVSFPITALSTNSGLVQVAKPTLGNIASSLFERKNSLVIPLPNGTNISRLVPTHALSLDSSQLFDPRTTQSFVTSATKFQPFEQLSGIAHERPEIIMLSNMLPLFDNTTAFVSMNSNFSKASSVDHMSNQNMTDAGKYVESQIQMRNLASWDMQHMLRTVSLAYGQVNQEFIQRSRDVMTALSKLNNHSKYLLNLIRILDEEKNHFDLRHPIHRVNSRELAQFVTNNWMPTQRDVITTSLISGLKNGYDCAQCLIDLGYASTNVRSIFSSTKIWLQTLSELKAILKHHSYKLIDIDPIAQRNDKNAIVLTQPDSKYFGISTKLPALPNLTELINLELSNATKTLGILKPAYQSMYQNVFFKNEEARIAALVHLLTQEYRYSLGLSKSTVVTALQNFYGFSVALTGNTTMLDSVFGSFGNNITDFPATSDSSLASIAQNTIAGDQEQGVAILTFESKYIEGTTGTTTPGGEFFIDRVMVTSGEKFNTSAIDSLVVQLDDQLKSLNTIIDGLNLFSLSTQTNLELGGTPRNQLGGFLISSYDTVNELAKKLINVRTGVKQSTISNDKLSTVYSRARNDNNIKTLLFLYTLAKISRNYNKNVPFFASRNKADNTPLVDYLVNKIIDEVIDDAPVTKWQDGLTFKDGFYNSASLTRDNLKNALKTGTEISTIIEQFMSSVISQFSIETTAIQEQRTRYSGHLDTVIMMLAFDFAISMIARYTNQSIVGTHGGVSSNAKGQDFITVSTDSSYNHLQSYEELKNRITAEGHLAQQMLLAIINVLRIISGTLKGLSNYLNSKETVEQLQEIAHILNNDKNMIRMLLSEHQIMMLASTVEGLIATLGGVEPNKTKEFSVGKVQISSNSTSYHEGLASSDAIVILDESIVSIEAREALYALFNTANFATSSAINKRIVTVGVPAGFTRRLKQKVDAKNQTERSFEGKQSDIVRINVYKVDIQNPDIIYKPQKFLFEMSRFPVSAKTRSWRQIPANASLKDIVYAIPTHNFEPGSSLIVTDTLKLAGVEYASSTTTDRGTSTSLREAFQDSGYNFLSKAEKTEILQNHVLSQLLELYIKLLTGINVSEYNYNMKDIPEPMDSAFAKSLLDRAMQYVVDQTKNHAGMSKSKVDPPRSGVLFSTVPKYFGATLSSTSGIAGHVIASNIYAHMPQAIATPKRQDQTPVAVTTSLDVLRPRDTYFAVNTMRSLSVTSKTMSSISSAEAVMQRILMPKQFDRVFNLVVDSRDFEIDVEATTSSQYGQQALELLIKHGDIIPGDTASNGVAVTASNTRANSVREIGVGRAAASQVEPNINNFRYRNRDKNQGDLISDKYFITIETYGEGIV